MSEHLLLVQKTLFARLQEWAKSINQQRTNNVLRVRTEKLPTVDGIRGRLIIEQSIDSDSIWNMVIMTIDMHYSYVCINLYALDNEPRLVNLADPNLFDSIMEIISEAEQSRMDQVLDTLHNPATKYDYYPDMNRKPLSRPQM